MRPTAPIADELRRRRMDRPLPEPEPMIDTQQFLKLLAGTNLMTPELLGKLRARIAGTPGVDALKVARKLVERGDLTAWQAQQLLAGRNAFYLGRYQLAECIGEGGMGIVFRARHAMMDRTVAVKVLSRDLLRKPRAVARFNREVKAAAALHHPNIIVAYDADRVGDSHFLVMEYAQGRDLNYWLRCKGAFPVSAACECGLQVAEGLQHAFQKGMVHRDIKPVNLLVTWDKDHARPVIKILDMGLARFASEAQQDDEGLTRAGQTIGTPDYIAPEAADNFKAADIRADIFSLGCTLFRLLTGKLPFGGSNTVQKLLARVQNDAPLASSLRADVPPELDAVLAKMMARTVTDRYQTPAEVIEALAPFAASRIGDQASLEFFSVVPPDPSPNELVAEEDADTSMEEFFRDFTVAPQRDDSADAKEEVLSLIEFDEDDDEEPLPLDQELPKPKQPAPLVAKLVTPGSAPAKSASPRKAAAVAASETITEIAPLEGLPQALADDQAGLDVDPLPLEGFDDAAAESDKESQEQGKKSRKWLNVGGRRREARRWDSPFMLYGGGALLLFVVGGIGMALNLQFRSGEKKLEEAERAYGQQDFAQAAYKLDEFIKEYPQHVGAPQAHVHRGIAQLRQLVDTGSEWPTKVKQCTTVLADLQKKYAKPFTAASNDIQVLLTRLAEGLANTARKNQQPELLDESRAALTLIDYYVVKSLRPAAKIAEIETLIANVGEEIGRNLALKAALEKINAAIAAGHFDEAYAERERILIRYPVLADDPALAEVLTRAAAALQANVKVTSEPIAPVAAGAPAFTTLALAERSGEKVAASAGEVVTALADGAVWGIDAESGAPLWRMQVGVTTTIPPQPIGIDPGDDLLIVDAEHGQVARVVARSGEVKWRHHLQALLSGPPLLTRGQAVLATSDGELRWLNLDDGSSPRQVKLPQVVTSGPAIEARGAQLYQIANHSNLYVLSAADGACSQVLYLGQQPGSVVLPPLVISRYVIVAENHLATASRLRVLLVDDQGVNAQQVQQLDLEGQMTTLPIIAGRTMHLVTDRGAWYSFEISQAGEGDPLKMVVERGAVSGDPVARYPLARGGEAWVADQQLARYQVQSTRGRLVPQGVTFANSTFLQAPVWLHDLIFHLRRAAGGRLVAAMSRPDDGNLVWESTLAAPPLAAIAAGDRGLELLRTDGRLFAPTAQQLTQGGVLSQSATSIEVLAAPSEPLPAPRIPDGWIAAADAGGHQILARRGGRNPQLQWATISDVLTGPLVSLRAGIVVPGQSGQIQVVDPAGVPAPVQPFQPLVEPGVAYQWQAAAIDDARLVASDCRTKIYVLQVKGEPAQLTAAAEADLPSALQSGLAVTGETVYGVLAGGSLQSWNVADLQARESASLPGGATWGPRSAGKLALVATGDEQLLAWDGNGQQVWKVPLAGGRPCGEPLALGETLAVALAGGKLLMLDPVSGESRSEVDFGQPLVAGPLVVGDRVVCVGADGTLFTVPRP
ncbi:MAG: protein kinase [Pirellulales bacterium]|nr:protein kinase [Pirellulales bacterium]